MTRSLISRYSLLFAFTLSIAFCLAQPSGTFAQKITSELFKLQSNETGDKFGSTIAFSGDRVLVTAWHHKPDPAVFVYDIDTGNLVQKISAPPKTGSVGFARAAAFSGKTAIVGSFLDDDAGEDAGAVHIYDVTNRKDHVKLTAEETNEGDFFGNAVALDGNLSLVSAPYALRVGNGSGRAYLFDVETKEELFTLIPPELDRLAVFGWFVALKDDWALIRADGFKSPGSVYVFHAKTGQFLRKLTAPKRLPTDNFGQSISIHGNRALIGCPHTNGASGAPAGEAYLFDLQTGEMLRAFSAPKPELDDRFGLSVALEGEIGVIGAYETNGPSELPKGEAYLFDVSDGKLLEEIELEDRAEIDRFGASVAIQGQRVAVGAAGFDHYEKVYVLALDPTPVRLASFSAKRINGDAQIRWSVADATDHLGFQLYRSEFGAPRAQISSGLLRGQTSYTFIDRNTPNARLEYWLAELSRAGATEWHGPVVLQAQHIRPQVRLTADPNPFLASTTLHYSVDEAQNVSVSIFDIQGKRVRTLASREHEAGAYRLTWDGQSDAGVAVAPGLYFATLVAGETVKTWKLVRTP